jgi:hypothetical protein
MTETVGATSAELEVEAREIKRARGLTKAEKRLLAPAGCRAYMRRTLVKEFPEIVQGFVDAAKTGSCPHVKMVTELMRPIRQGSPRQKKGTMVRLFERLEKERLEDERLKGEREETERLEKERLEAERLETEASTVAPLYESSGDPR